MFCFDLRRCCDCFRCFDCHFDFRLCFDFCKIDPCVYMGYLVAQFSLGFLFHWLVFPGLLPLGGPLGPMLLSTVFPIGVYLRRF